MPALGVEKYAYSTIAKMVEIPFVKYGWSAPQLYQGSYPTCGPTSFVELYYTTMVQNGRDPILLSPHDLAHSYEEYVGEPFDGVYNRLMFLVAAKTGVCSFQDWPTTDNTYGKAPPAGVKRHNFRAYHTVAMELNEILNCLAEGYNFLVGIPVYENFVEAEDGIITMPKGKFLGGHDVLIQGYDLNREIVFGQNHWDQWGFSGSTFVGSCHFSMPIEYLLKLGSDAWTITLA